jgi:FkbM family methyltransferase
MLYDFYMSLRRAVRGRGLSRYRFLRNLDYSVRKFIKKPKGFIYIRDFKFFLDPKNSISEKDIDTIETKLFELLIKPGNIFVDVGAHLGWYSVIVSRLVGSAGKVFSFEPNPFSYGMLKKNLAENKCANVSAEQFAVSDENGECSIYTIGDLWFGSRIIDPRKDPDFFITPNVSDFDDKTIRESKVRKISLDNYFGNSRVDFVKIDTEGNDGHVFAGMQNLIKNNPQIIIFMEFAPALLQKSGTSPERLVSDIRNLGFNIFMTDGSTLKPFRELPGFNGNLLVSRKDIRKALESIIT